MRQFILAGFFLIELIGSVRAEDRPAEAKIAVDRLAKYEAADPHPTTQMLAFVYFTPADRTPPDGYRQRLGRVMINIQKFYADEMERNGLGRRTVKFSVDPDGSLVLFDVKGKLPTADYLEEHGAASKGSVIARESRPVLRAAGVNPDKQTVIFFCDLRTEKDNKVTGIGPYYGSGPFSGSFGNGRCWFTDATIMDADKLSDKTTMLEDQQYHHISVGKYNSIFIGGAAHELGHALGLPHDKEQKNEGNLHGTSLMGSGNRTYHDELHDQGKGSFLTLGDALRLAAHPMFCGSDRGIRDKLECKIEDLKAEVHDKGLDLTGHIAASPEPYAVVVYNDPYSGSDYYHGSFRDYDSTTWTGVLDDKDNFKVRIGEFKPGGAKLRVVICHVNGASNEFAYPLSVAADGTPDASEFTVPVALHDAISAWARGDLINARDRADKIACSTAASFTLKKWASMLVDICMPDSDFPDLSEIPSSVKEISLSRVRWDKAVVGFADPARNHFPAAVDPTGPFLNCGGKLYTDGFYAHAPSHYLFNLGDGTRWKSFSAIAGLQATATGAAIFVVKGDGKELFRSKAVEDTSTEDIRLNIEGVKSLELVVETDRNDNRRAWADWCDAKVWENSPAAPELLQGAGGR